MMNGKILILCEDLSVRDIQDISFLLSKRFVGIFNLKIDFFTVVKRPENRNLSLVNYPHTLRSINLPTQYIDRPSWKPCLQVLSLHIYIAHSLHHFSFKFH